MKLALLIISAFIVCAIIYLSMGLFKSKSTLSAEEFFKDPQMLAAARYVQKGDTEKLKSLAAEGLDVNASGEHGMTLLIFALGNQQKKAIKVLLDLKADPNVKLEDGDTAVTLAAGAKDIEMLRILLENGGDPNARNQHGQPAIFEAAGRSLWDHFELLVARGADIKATDRRQQTILLRLASVNRFEDVERLLPRGFDIHQADESGATLAWYVDRRVASSKTAQGQARERVRKLLQEKGITFPVPLPKPLE